MTCARFYKLMGIVTNLEEIRDNLNDTKLVAVSKGKSIDEIYQAVLANQKDFGENYVQEALKKIEALKEHHLHWHYLGRVQSNKISDIVKYFEFVHSVDSLKAAEALSLEAKKQNKIISVFLQVNFEGEESKGGFTKEQLEKDLAKICALKYINVLGLMLIPAPKAIDIQRTVFAEFREYRDSLEEKYNVSLSHLSMGMSDDYLAALEEGATYIRVGTKIFGERKQ